MAVPDGKRVVHCALTLALVNCGVACAVERAHENA